MKIVVIKGRGIIAPFVIEGYVEAFKQEGHEVLQLAITSRMVDVKTMEIIKNFAPDIAVCYGSPHSILKTKTGFFFREIGLVLNILFYDMPFFTTDESLENEFKQYNDYYNFFIWDDLFLEIFKGHGYKNCYKIMLAVDTTKFYPIENIVKINEAAFVGSLRADDLSKKIGVAEIDDFIDRVVELKIGNISVPTIEIIQELLRDKKYELVKKLFMQNEKNFWKTIYYTIHAKGSAVARYCILNGYAQGKINIFGSIDWEKENVLFHKSVKYGVELLEVYQKYAVNINISSLQLETSVNNRVFDCFGAKGFLLSDYRKDMEVIFPEITQEICFNSIDEMNSKSEYFLLHEKERKELTEQGYNNIISGHTYRHRVREVLSRNRIN